MPIIQILSLFGAPYFPCIPLAPSAVHFHNPTFSLAAPTPQLSKPQPKPSQILLNPMRVIHARFLTPADIKQRPPGLGKAAAVLADFDDGGELELVEEVYVVEGFLGEPLMKVLRFGFVGCVESAPGFAEAFDFGCDQGLRDAAAFRQGGHAGDAGVEVAEVGAPEGFGGVGEF